jgi:hypothetical protein
MVAAMNGHSLIPLLALAVAGVGATQAGAVTVPVGSIPASATTAAGFAPPGWIVEQRARGDLDRDGDRDQALVLVQHPAAGAAYGENDGSRALVLVRRLSDGTLRRAGVSPALLGCRQCGGAFWGAAGMPVQVRLAGGNLVVTQQFGASVLTETVHRIRWNAATRKFRLIGLDTVVVNRNTLRETEVSTNHLTRRQIRIVRQGTRVVSRTTRSIGVSPRPIAGLVFGRTSP